MARIFKFLLALLLSIVSVALALVLLLLLTLKFVDWSEHKDLLVNLTERYTDWQVEQLGDLEIALYFPTRVKLSNAELTQQAPDSALASVSADSFEVSLNPLSFFLNDSPVIHNIEASAARIVAETPEQPSEDTEPLTLPQIEAARLRDTRIVYRGEDSQQVVNLHLAALDADSRSEGEGLSISGKGELTVAGNGRTAASGNDSLDLNFAGTTGALGDLSEDSPLPFDFEGNIAEDDFAVQGQVATGQQVSGRAQLSLSGDGLPRIAEAFGISLGNVPSYQLGLNISGSPEQIRAENIQVRLGESSLSGHASLLLQGPRPSLRADLSSELLRRQDLLSLMPEGTSPASTSGSQPPSPDGLPQLDFLNALNARVSYSVADYQGELAGPVSGAELDARLEDGQLDVAGRVGIEGETIELNAALGPRQRGPEAPNFPFNLAVSMAGDTLVSEGRITASNETVGYRAELSGDGDNLSAIAQVFGLELGDVPAYQLDFSLSGSTEQIRIRDIRASLGQSSLRGDARLVLDAGKPYLRADLTSPLLRRQDLASLLPQDSTQAEPADSPSGPAPPLDFLEMLNADLAYRIAEYQGETLGPIDSGRFGLSLEDGQLDLAARVDAEDLNLTLEGALGPRQGGAESPVLPFFLVMVAAGDVLSAEGRIAVENGNIRLRAETSAVGNSLGSIAQLFDLKLTGVPPYKLSFVATGTPQQISIEDIQATLGNSYVYGDVSLQLDQAKPYLDADLGSSLLREQDLASLMPRGPEQPDTQAAPPLDMLDALNADISFAVAELEGERLGQLSGGSLEATLDNGELDLAAETGVEGMQLALDGKLGPTPPGTETPSLPFRVELAAADDTFRSEGQITLEEQGITFRADTRAMGDSLGRIAALFEVELPDPPPYQLSFVTEKSANEISLSDLQLTLGQSYLYGQAALQLGDPRPYLSADLGISLLRQQDLAGLIPENGEPDEYVFSREPLNLAALHQLDADLELAIGAYTGSTGAALISGLTVQGHLENGRLALRPIDISLAGGTVEGRLQLDSRDDPARLRVDLAAESVQLNDLVSPFFDLEEQDMQVRGGMDANLEVTSSGNSLHDWASQLNGDLNWAIYDGVIPAVVVEALGLDPTEAAISWFGDTVSTGIHCGVGQFPIVNGVVGTETFLLSTEDANIVGDGAISLVAESVNYQLEAQPKDFSVLASGSPIQIEGTLNNISIDVGSGELLASLGASAALALINPALAVIPFVELGTGDTGQCRALQEELRKIEEESDEEIEE